MSKRVYVSAGYDPNNGDHMVVDELIRWENANGAKQCKFSSALSVTQKERRAR